MVFVFRQLQSDRASAGHGFDAKAEPARYDLARALRRPARCLRQDQANHRTESSCRFQRGAEPGTDRFARASKTSSEPAARANNKTELRKRRAANAACPLGGMPVFCAHRLSGRNLV